MRAAAPALTAFKISIARRSATLSGLQYVRIIPKHMNIRLRAIPNPPPEKLYRCLLLPRAFYRL